MYASIVLIGVCACACAGGALGDTKGYDYSPPAISLTSALTASPTNANNNANANLNTNANIFESVPPQIAAVIRAPLRPSAEYEKEFFYYMAPEEGPQGQQRAPQKKVQVTQAKKNLRVVAIKSPDSKYQGNAQLNLAKNAVQLSPQLHTHIYVLSRQPSVGVAPTVQAQGQIQIQAAAPQVKFLKYSSPEEARLIQQNIIQQYQSKYAGPSSQIVIEGGAGQQQQQQQQQQPQQQQQQQQQQPQQQQQQQPPPVVRFLNYKTIEEARRIQSDIVRQYGGGRIQQSTPGVSGSMESQGKTNVDRTYLAPTADSVDLRSSTAVDKNYAKNYLPPGVDVVPGSSYIPLLVRA